MPYYGAYLASRPEGRKGICDIYGEDFEIGKVVATRRVWDLMTENQQFHDFVSGCLSRYILYDWGDTCPEDWRANNEAALHGERVMAVYNIPEDMESEFEEHLWIITERDRSATTLLFPSDY
jgi:hypothetical protein